MANEGRQPTRMDRRAMLLGGTSVIAAAGLVAGAQAQGANQGQHLGERPIGGRASGLRHRQGAPARQEDVPAWPMMVMGPAEDRPLAGAITAFRYIR
jgi:hypothetical protein